MTAGAALSLAAVGALFAMVITGDDGPCTDDAVHQEEITFDNGVLVRALCAEWGESGTRVLIEAEVEDTEGVLDTDSSGVSLANFDEGDVRVEDREQNRLTLVLPPHIGSEGDNEPAVTLTALTLETEDGPAEFTGRWELQLRD